MYFSLLYTRYNKNFNLAAAAFSVGMALAVKLSFLAIVPIIYVLIRKRLNPLYWLAVLGGIFIVFVAAQGGHYTPHNFALTMDNVRNDNINVVNVKNNKLWNPFIYLAGIPPALGLVNLIFLVNNGDILSEREIQLETPVYGLFFHPDPAAAVPGFVILFKHGHYNKQAFFTSCSTFLMSDSSLRAE